ncbi:hypothetical protein BS47DRAFT_1384885 [Hydnum rufescens UP504]|uniref:HNH nuclease domain-containing protein n=1 Tax=Hydnum rufescens UP504 TaxID=1448309 RepID=A0A9P6DNK8_9AGAM|nr:hypothetical protein BS47DRAFT_1384885 [Hydnum rufescens UP504]
MAKGGVSWPHVLKNFQHGPMEPKIGASTVTWAMLKNFAGIEVAKFAGKEINHPANAFLSVPNVNILFSLFLIYFDPTGIPHQYIVRTFYEYEFTNRTVIFRDHSGHKGPIPLPDPDLLAVHHALAEVVHASGAAEESDRLWNEHTEFGGLEPNGSTDIETLFAMNAARRIQTE